MTSSICKGNHSVTSVTGWKTDRVLIFTSSGPKCKNVWTLKKSITVICMHRWIAMANGCLSRPVVLTQHRLWSARLSHHGHLYAQMDSDGKWLPKQACRSNPTSSLKCETFDSAMPNGQGCLHFVCRVFWPGISWRFVLVGWGGVPIPHSQNNLPQMYRIP